MALASLGSQRVRGARGSSLIFWVWRDHTCFMIVAHNGNTDHLTGILRDIKAIEVTSQGLLAGEDCYNKLSFLLKLCCCWFSHRYICKWFSFQGFHAFHLSREMVTKWTNGVEIGFCNSGKVIVYLVGHVGHTYLWYWVSCMELMDSLGIQFDRIL